MRKELVLILALLVGGGLLAYRWIGTSPIVFSSARGVVSVDSSGSSATPADTGKGGLARSKARGSDKQNQVSKKDAPRVPEPELNAEAAKALATEPTEKTPGASQDRPDFPFPTPQDLRKGSSVAEIISQFGTPTMDVAKTRDGRFLERYYYVNGQRDRLTLAEFENGQLVSAVSLSSPFHLPKPAAQGSGLR